MNLEQNILQIPIDNIIPNRFQPRLTFEDRGLEELANSIKQHGIIQPLVLRRIGDKYEIIAGERRYKAATLAGLDKVPAIIADIHSLEFHPNQDSIFHGSFGRAGMDALPVDVDFRPRRVKILILQLA